MYQIIMMSSVSDVMFKEAKVEKFLHCIDLDNWLPCWNISASSILTSINAHVAGPTGMPLLRDAPISDLRGNPPGGTYSPRAIVALLSKRGTDMANLEIKFEEVRRKNKPESISRLECLWVAEDNLNGRMMLSNMFPNYKKPYLLNVRCLPLTNIERYDAVWIEEYSEHGETKYIEGYWSGLAYNNESPQWEYLVSGRLECYVPDQVKNVQQKGGHRFLIEQGSFDPASFNPISP